MKFGWSGFQKHHPARYKFGEVDLNRIAVAGDGAAPDIEELETGEFDEKRRKGPELVDGRVQLVRPALRSPTFDSPVVDSSVGLSSVSVESSFPHVSNPSVLAPPFSDSVDSGYRNKEGAESGAAEIY